MEHGSAPDGGLPEVAEAQPAIEAEAVPHESDAGTFAWDWLCVRRMSVTLVVVTVVTFVLAVALGALAPGLPSHLLRLIEKVQLWPTTWLTGVWAMFFIILLNNMRAAFIGALIGPGSVWLNARLNSEHPDLEDDVRPSAGERVASAIARALIGVGRRAFPALADDDLDFAARASAALAAVVPYMAVGANATMLGVWLADGLLRGWVGGFAERCMDLLPHGPVEFPALVLSTAMGLWLASHLVPRRLGENSDWQAGEVKRLLKSNRVAQSLAAIIALLLIAAALEVTGMA